jgi:AAA+ ATPase superfamily predicted ATPase
MLEIRNSSRKFIGRKAELESLRELLKKNSASLAVIQGRRRVGKSRLAKEFAAQSNYNFLEFQGLAPDIKTGRGLKAEDQLEFFAMQVSEKFKLPEILFKNWFEALTFLARKVKNKHQIVMLDELSWMAQGTPQWSGILKSVWDTHFSENNKLILILCGSVSIWIEDQILSHTNFVGRISLSIQLHELTLNESFQMLESKKITHLSSKEIFTLLAITGGIPKYLEEINLKSSASNQIANLCFKKSGFLFNEFDRIFTDILQKQSPIYKRILKLIADRRYTPSEISEELNIPLNGDLTTYLHHLEISGFITKDYTFDENGKTKKQHRFRLSDNYLRFYFKYIEPNKERIEKNSFSFKHPELLPQWNTIVGLQFQNLILSSISSIIDNLNINPASVISASPFIQRKNTKNKGGCEIDLLIYTRNKTYHVCEIKFQNQITQNIISEVKNKIEKLKVISKSSVRPILIYHGEINDSDRIQIEDYFDSVIDIDSWVL